VDAAVDVTSKSIRATPLMLDIIRLPSLSVAERG